jgi:UDP-N-acetylglucosamine 2-epimerase (non-hydrolysing)
MCEAVPRMLIEAKNRGLIMIVAGTRPEAIKLAPVIEWLDMLKVNYVFIWSGQHYDYEMSKIFFEQLGLPEPDENLDVRSGSQAEQTAKIMMRLEKTINKYKPAIVVAEGDTNTVVATALTATKKLVPFAHVEAGLRSWDRTMPEEVNRIIADAIAELHFAPTELAAVNLMHEGVSLRKIHIVGNTIVDVVLKYQGVTLKEGSKLLDELDVEPYGYILATVHRQENTDNPWRLENIVKALVELSKHYPVIFPVHPRTKRRLNEYGLWQQLKSQKNIFILDPLGYFQFLGLLAQALIVLTDSGGVQEEACTLKVPTITLRYNTERPETVLVGINKVVGVAYRDVVREALLSIDNRDNIIKKATKRPNPLGDGKSGQRIAYVLKESLYQGIGVESSDTRNALVSYKLIDLAQKPAEIHDETEIITLYTAHGNPTTSLKHSRFATIRKIYKDVNVDSR